jgi:23S rRNA pseudouridine955/2504/2580 synthase
VRHHDIDAERAGQRLDNYLLGELKGVPRSHVYRLIRSGQVRVNSGRTSPSYRLQAGDRVRVPPVGQRRAAAEPVASPDRLDWLAERIIHEDARVLVIDKPAGLAVHGGSSVSLGVIEALRLLRPTSKDLELAHRLDRGTSGCLLLAKRRSTLRVLHELLREGLVDKRYLTLVKGSWADDSEIDAPLVTRRVGGEARVKVDPAGKEARSRFRTLDRFGKTATLLEVSIDTGRTHQIRVHAAHAGHPVAGDDRYGDKDYNAYLRSFGLQRMFLHAHSLSFDWPDTGEPFNASAPLPDDLRAVLTALEIKAAADRRPVA